ncbi:PREDICTED: E3 ubiquitin-protein ligase HECW2-like [Priapulus caudatus]|uniref:HECT-type E3 ubiquitin transferase n=1 Tax=Priapulus caudatus TaxID=37621 RepID=A0ABM1E1S0_PRICU|nr:PREDICTED: E3 ubiquitin-protein ligase HECW2-like [Priapulus caudatus]
MARVMTRLIREKEQDPFGFLEHKKRGLAGSRQGQVVWAVNSLQLFTQPVTRVCFRYYHGSTGALRASSATINIINPNTANRAEVNQKDNSQMVKIVVSTIRASGLRKGMFFSPDPYVKLSIKPGPAWGSDGYVPKYWRTHVVQNTINPEWNGQKFGLAAYPGDTLLFEVKDKFARSRPIGSRFLGQVQVQLSYLQQKAAKKPREKHVLIFSLAKRHPSDSVTGKLAFFFIISDQTAAPSNGVLLCGSNSSGSQTSSASQGSGETSTAAMLLSDAATQVTLYALSRGRIGNHEAPVLPPGDAVVGDNYRELQAVFSDIPAVDDSRLSPVGNVGVDALPGETGVTYEGMSPVGAETGVSYEHMMSVGAETGVDYSHASVSYDDVGIDYGDLETDGSVLTNGGTAGAPPYDDDDDGESCDRTAVAQNGLNNLSSPAGTLTGRRNIPMNEMNISTMDSDDGGGGSGGEARWVPRPAPRRSRQPPQPDVDPSRGHTPPGLSSYEDAVRGCSPEEEEEGSSRGSPVEEAVNRDSIVPQIGSPENLESRVDGDFTDQTPAVASTSGMQSRQASYLDQHQRLCRAISSSGSPCYHTSQQVGCRPSRSCSRYSNFRRWEARVDTHGRIFYIDHVNRTTTWERPQATPALQRKASTAASEHEREQFDRRYQSIRRTINRNRNDDLASLSIARPDTSPRPAAQATQAQSPQRAAARSPSPANQQAVASGSAPGVAKGAPQRAPAVLFLSRPDFFPLLHTNEMAFGMYTGNTTLKHMISKIRRDSGAFERYQHNRDLVVFLNLFADSTIALPVNWELKTDKTGKSFFIDHVRKTTTFIDPRLPVEVPAINPQSLQMPSPRRPGMLQTSGPVPPPRPPGITLVAPPVPEAPVAYNDKVVAFLRQANINEILAARQPSYASNSKVKDKVNLIRMEGTKALTKLSNDVDLIILLSLFEQEVMSYIPEALVRLAASNSSASSASSHESPVVPRANVRAPAPYRRDFETKLRGFYRKLESKGYGQGPGKIKLTVRRDHVLEDAFTKIMQCHKKELQKNKLYITFVGEEGLDYGGPSREFFYLLSRELFNPYYGLFEYSANDTYTVQVSPVSQFVENHLEWFRFAGRVLGLALIHQYLLDAFFTRPFYKALLRLPCSLSDLESLDAEFHQSLLWIKENDITDILDLTFSVDEEVFGQVTERELKPGGMDVAMTEKNKKEYIELMVRWRLERGVCEQTDALVRGFYDVIEHRVVSTFDARELELVIAGTMEIDIQDWRRNTEYRSGYHDGHPVIQWFWMAIERFDNERRLRLLQFVTGTSSIPYEGFAALRGSNGPRRFCIEKWGNISSLPRAHTCFNRLDLPPYMYFSMLFEKLILAVEETSTFGVE